MAPRSHALLDTGLPVPAYFGGELVGEVAAGVFEPALQTALHGPL